MRIEVNAKLILTVSSELSNETPPEIVLAAEQEINSLPVFHMSGTENPIGVRLHVQGIERVDH